MTQVLIDRATLEQLVGALEEADDYLEQPPARNCSCHISPPCNDCVDYSGLREYIKQVARALTAGRAALAGAERPIIFDLETEVTGGTVVRTGPMEWSKPE